MYLVLKRNTDIADCSLEIAPEENIKSKDTVVERNPLMSEKEFYDKIDLSLKQVQEGKETKLESLDDFDKIFGS